MKTILTRLPFALSVAVLLPGAAAALVAADGREGVAFFESRIRPVLVKECYECHSAESGKAKGGLQLDTRDAVREGGDSGAAVVPGDPGASLLLTAIAHDDPDLKMPPKQPRLSAAIRDDFERWIAGGAPDPRRAGATAGDENSSSDAPLWSHEPPAIPELPEVENETWPGGAIDRFVLARLEANDMTPSPDAPAPVLLRRLCFDLVGLPPTPEQAARFSPADLESVVDELLASDPFGARWGRHWLDVARFAESNGRESNIIYPEAWRYRDYVIEAFNEDLPFDRFILEQLAGDRLPAGNDRERARHLVATGFLAVGAKGLGQMSAEQFAADLVDEQIDATTRALIGTSVACARCHDHKSDPISMEDYYAFAGIFRSTETCYGTWVDSENNNPGDLIRLPDLPGQLVSYDPMPGKRVEKLEEELAALKREDEERKARIAEARAEGRDLREEYDEMLKNALRIYWRSGGIRGKLATVDDEGNPLPLCMGVREAEAMADSPVYERGELGQAGASVPRGVPALFGMDPMRPGPGESGRLELAKWFVHPDQPLTARVMVNRIWRQLFGAGLVSTEDNFGHSGKPPSHPELLDYLAVRFVESGWSTKAVIREIVLSRTYRQASTHRGDCYERDPDNRLLWRVSPRRLDAEVIRDSMLAVSGRLDLSPRPGSLVHDLNSHTAALIGFAKHIPKDLDGSRRRSVYLPVIRENLPDVLDLFDFAEPSLVVGDREETNMPLQALYLMNSDFVRTQAEALAERLEEEESTREARIRRAFRLCFNRAPTERDRALVADYFQSGDAESGDAQSGDAESGDAQSGDAAGPDRDEHFLLVNFCQALLATAEFRIAN